MTATAAQSALARAESPAPGADWLIEDPAGIVELRLAHADRPRPDGGVLRIDPNRRVVTWEGIPGDLGCRQKLEASFNRIRAVRDDPEGVLRLEVQGEPRDRWRFVPLPHAAWLVQASSSVVFGFAPGLRDSLRGPDDSGGRGGGAGPMPIGGSALFAGPQTRADIVPSEVTSDVRLAALRLRQGLGRTALPTVQVYEALHGRPVAVGIAELIENPGLLEGRAVRVRGIASSLPRNRGIELADADQHLTVVPLPEIAALIGAAARQWQGKEVEVTGVVRRAPGAADGPSHEVAFWEYLGPDQASTAPDAEVRTVTIRELIEQPTLFAGQTVRVVGKFRGKNLLHDLPEPGPRGAWVIKSRRNALWVVGRGPSGQGFSLNPNLERDTTRWLEVVGRIESKDGASVLRASAVALSPPAAFVWNGPRVRTDPRPEVVFTLPLEGEDLPTVDARLLVQFSANMDEETFEGRVGLCYEGEGPDGGLKRVGWTYDDVRHVLIVDPGEPLRAGAVLEVLLMPGIADVYAAPLEPLPGAGPGDPARRLRWHVSQSPIAALPEAP